jgi:hypothetical protein
MTAPPADPFDDEDDLPAGGVSAGPAPVGDGEEGGTARITLRLPEQLKGRIEDAAGTAGLSVNAWLVRAVAAAAEPHGPDRTPRRRSPAGGQRYTGWAR